MIFTIIAFWVWSGVLACVHLTSVNFMANQYKTNARATLHRRTVQCRHVVELSRAQDGTGSCRLDSDSLASARAGRPPDNYQL